MNRIEEGTRIRGSGSTACEGGRTCGLLARSHGPSADDGIGGHCDGSRGRREGLGGHGQVSGAAPREGEPQARWCSRAKREAAIREETPSLLKIERTCCSTVR